MREVTDITFFNDRAAFIGLVDIATYQSDLPNWDYDSLASLVIRQMRLGRIVAWEGPEDEFKAQLRIDPKSKPSGKVHASFSHHFVSSGRVCVSPYGSLTMAAQFADESLPNEEDPTFILPAGPYLTQVHQMFPWDGEQLREEIDVPFDYIIDLRSVSTFKDSKISEVPWAREVNTPVRRFFSRISILFRRF